jgi:CRISPR-associated protein Cst2
MAFLTGVVLFDAPAGALNNSGADTSARTDNAVAVKAIRSAQGTIPYISAQAFRYWLRTTVERGQIGGWRAAPVYREQKVAYTDANPLEYWDDDLFGYMRAQSKRTDAAARRQADATRATETPTTADITRVSPFRVSTLLSLAPQTPTQDFGTMSRHDGDPVPHEHQFYHTVMRGLLSLDLHASGTFSYRSRTGFRNLDEERIQRAIVGGLEHLESEQSYRLPHRNRVERIAALISGLAVLSGGAKQAIHYTDVTPVVAIAMVTRGGNNPLHYIIGADSKGLPDVRGAAVEEMFRVWQDQILSPIYVGWTQGFHDAQRERLVSTIQGLGSAVPHGVIAGHPREVLDRLTVDVGKDENANWLK